MDKRLPFALKKCGLESSIISFFFLSFDLQVCSSFIFDFVVTCFYYLNVAYVHSPNTHIET